MESITTIEPLQKADIEDILNIQVENNLSSWNSEDYLAEIGRPDTSSFVTRDNGIITGFIISRLITQGDYFHNEIAYSETEIEIYNLAVVKNHRKKGIGTLLLREIIRGKSSAEKTTIWLEVRASNATAILFYKKNNFEEVYRRKNFYRNPLEDALVLRLEICSMSEPSKIAKTDT